MGREHDTPPRSPHRDDDAAEMDDILVDDDGMVVREVHTLDDAPPDDDASDEDEDGAIGDSMMAEEAPEDMSKLTLDGHKDSTFVCAFSPADGSKLAATGGEDDCARLWNLETGAVLFTSSGHKDSIVQVCFSSDGKLLAVGDMAGLVHVYRIPSYERCWEFDLGEDLTWLAWHPVAAALLAGTQDGSGWMWKIPRGDVRMLTGHGSSLTKASVLPDGTRLLAGYEDGSCRVFNLRTGETVHHFSGVAAHRAPVTCAAVHSDNTLVATGSMDGFVRFYSAATGKVLATLPCCPEAGTALPEDDDMDESGGSGGARTVESAVFSSSDANLLATATCGGVLTVWDVSAQKPRHQLGDLPGLSCLQWAPKESGKPSRLFAGCLDGSVQVIDARGGTVEKELTSVVCSVLDLAVSADGNTVLAAMEDGKARIFDVASALAAT